MGRSRDRLTQASQAISFTSTPPASPVVGGSYTVTATGGASGNPVTFSIDSSSTAGVCSISGASVSFTGAGTCVVDANQAGNASYLAAPQVSQSLSIVAQTAQAILFTSSPPASPVVGGSYTVAATGGGSGNPVTFAIDPFSTLGACSISGAAVSFTGAGSCVIDANQAGNATYSAAPQVSQTLSIVAQTVQAITFISTPPASPVVGGSYTVAAGGGLSGNPVTFSIDSRAARARARSPVRPSRLRGRGAA